MAIELGKLARVIYQLATDEQFKGKAKSDVESALAERGIELPEEELYAVKYVLSLQVPGSQSITTPSEFNTDWYVA